MLVNSLDIIPPLHTSSFLGPLFNATIHTSLPHISAPPATILHKTVCISEIHSFVDHTAAGSECQTQLDWTPAPILMACENLIIYSTRFMFACGVLRAPGSLNLGAELDVLRPLLLYLVITGTG